MTADNVWDQWQGRIADGWPERLADLVHRFEVEHQEAKGQLLAQARDMINRMERIIAHVEADESVGSTGEVQGLGSKVDVACALYMKNARDAALTAKILGAHLAEGNA